MWGLVVEEGVKRGKAAVVVVVELSLVAIVVASGGV